MGESPFLTKDKATTGTAKQSASKADSIGWSLTFDDNSSSIRDREDCHCTCLVCSWQTLSIHGLDYSSQRSFEASFPFEIGEMD